MGLKCASMHVLDGHEIKIRPFLPRGAQAGTWSKRFVSVYLEKDYDLVSESNTAREISEALSKTVIFAWIFDDDDVSFDVYQNGNSIFYHTSYSNGGGMDGDPAKFCEIFDLPPEDVSRLSILWKKGDALDQFFHTANLLGVSFACSADWLPTQMFERDEKAVDQWIAEQAPPAEIERETKAVLLQELPDFYFNRLSAPEQGRYYNEDTNDNDDADWYKCYLAGADGKLHVTYNAEEEARFEALKANFFMDGYLRGGDASKKPSRQNQNIDFTFLPSGEMLRLEGDKEDGQKGSATITLCAKDGSQIWQLRDKHGMYKYFGSTAGEIILTQIEPFDSHWLERLDIHTGALIEKIPQPFGRNAWSKVYNNGFWYVAHDGGHFALQNAKLKFVGKNRENTLTKFDSGFKPQAKLSIIFSAPSLFFSPGSEYLYIFFHKNEVQVLNPQSLAEENTLDENSFLAPLGFDSAGRFWLQRGTNTVEAWDALLTEARSRHKLEGIIVGSHTAGDGAVCVVTHSEKEKTLRVYKMQ
ncbi:MAG: hypothetical protein FWG66_10740 [Spirochaetes bacterium]|nr:hypothetical protein [Spirochaetota bacterium]